jgi:hypothetical protein
LKPSVVELLLSTHGSINELDDSSLLGSLTFFVFVLEGTERSLESSFNESSQSPFSNLEALRKALLSFLSGKV